MSSKKFDTMQIAVELCDQQFAQLAAYLVSEANRAGATCENGGAYEERFARLLECKRGSDGLIVTLECLVEFAVDKKGGAIFDNRQARHKVPSECLESLMRALELFPENPGRT